MRRRDLLAFVGGAVMAWPLAARAQKAMPVIGFLHSGASGPNTANLAGFREGLSETGYVEGRNLAIEYRWAEGRYERLPALAADLVERNVDVLASGGGPPSALAAKGATATIPVVFVDGDPVADGLVASLVRPGGNLTGVSIMSGELHPKRLELLSALVPQARVIGLLANRHGPRIARVIRDLREAAASVGVQLDVLQAGTATEIDDAFASLAHRHVGALIVESDAFFTSRREQLVALSARHAVPAVYSFREYTAAGGLISYAPNLTSAYRQVGVYVGRILKGDKPADLPVQQPTKYELVINLKTANALGLTVPPSLLARADEVIE